MAAAAWGRVRLPEGWEDQVTHGLRELESIAQVQCPIGRLADQRRAVGDPHNGKERPDGCSDVCHLRPAYLNLKKLRFFRETVSLGESRERVCVLFIGTQFSNLYTAVDTPASGRVGGERARYRAL